MARGSHCLVCSLSEALLTATWLASEPGGCASSSTSCSLASASLAARSSASSALTAARDSARPYTYQCSLMRSSDTMQHTV